MQGGRLRDSICQWVHTLSVCVRVCLSGNIGRWFAGGVIKCILVNYPVRASISDIGICRSRKTQDGLWPTGVLDYVNFCSGGWGRMRQL